MSELQEVIATSTIRAFNQGLQMGRASEQNRIIELVKAYTITEPSPFDDIPTVRHATSPNQLIDLIMKGQS